MSIDRIALDSQRSIDESGHLRVGRTILSKAAVNPYFGREIPDYEKHGLNPDKIYNLLRDPDALRESADTFRGKQLLIKHTYVDADNPEKELVIGSVGSDVEYVDGTLYGDITVWDAKAIELIETEKMEELSSSYWYEFQPGAGEFQGEKYDGKMIDLRANHVALVERGRIGRDAIISDALPHQLEIYTMNKKARAALVAKLRTAGVAADSVAEELIEEVAENIEHKPAFDDAKLRELAGDNYEKIVELIGGRADDTDKPAKDEDKGPKAEAERKKLEETDRDDRDAKKDDKREERKAAMDADAIAASVQSKIEAKYRARDKVEPLVGRIALDGFNSASEIYAYALKQKGIAHDGVNEAGLAQLVAITCSQSSNKVIAQDSAPAEKSKFTDRFRKA